jgi:hypothetical protein
MSKHTPGPWVKEGRIIKGERGEYIADVKWTSDMNLLFTAPELLDACKEAFNNIIGLNLEKRLPKTVELLESAIRKAEGEE